MNTHNNKDFDASASTWMPSPAMTFDLQHLTRSSVGPSGYSPLSLIDTDQVVCKIGCSQDLTLTPAVTLTFRI